jgi:hypothetical protein
MRKTNKAGAKNYTDLDNLALSWTPNTSEKRVRPNEEVSIDWGIINKKSLSDQNNVFALFLDMNTGLTFVFPAQSRGMASAALLAYIQRYGQPQSVRHDNAREFTHGEFADICRQRSIQQNRSAPFNPNQNHVEHYMDLIVTKM